MRYIIFLSLILMAYTSAIAGFCPAKLNKNAPLDRLLSQAVDVDGDGIADKIDLHIKADSFLAPFTWELKVTSKNKAIYSLKRSNGRINEFFSDKGYVEGCDNYEDCKCKWYFKDFLERAIVQSSAAVNLSTDVIRVTARKYLTKEKKNNSALVEMAINNAQGRIISGRAVLIQVFYEPEMHSPLMIWMPEFSRFVPIYQQ